MNNEDMIKFIESLDDEQRANFEKAFKIIGKEMGVEVKQTEVTHETQTVTNEGKEDFTMNRNLNSSKRGREPVKFKKNQWVDDGVEFSEIETPKSERTPRNRKKPNKKTVECHVCGKEFQLNSNLVYGEFHRCNRCGRR